MPMDIRALATTISMTIKRHVNNEADLKGGFQLADHKSRIKATGAHLPCSEAFRNLQAA